MPQLPQPIVHFDTALGDFTTFFKDMLALPTPVLQALMIDPSGRLAGMEDFAREHPATHALTRLTLMYDSAGQQVIVVGPRMQEAFAHTSLENIPPELLQLPHPAFYLATPQSEGLEIWGGSRTKWHRVEGCYVAMEPTMNSILILAWGAANEQSLNSADDAVFWFRIDLDDLIHGDASNLEKKFDAAVTDHGIANNAMREVEFESKVVELDLKGKALGVNLDRTISDIIGDSRSEASDLGMSLHAGSSAAHVSRVKETARKLLRIVVNAVLYMNSTSAEVSDSTSRAGERARLLAELKRLKNPRKAQGRKIQKKLDALPKSHIVWVGPTIEQEVGGERDLTGAGSRRTGHIRRGHWHTFRVGPRKVEGAAIPTQQRATTIKWIPPLWVAGMAKEPTGPRVYGLR